MKCKQAVRRSPLGLGVLAAGICGIAVGAAFGRGPVARPSFIVVMTDDQGYGDVGVHGNALIQTPNLDRFAAEGVELTRFYCSPVCAPTRASLMTGRYYYRTGVIHTSRGGAKMHGQEVTVAEILREAGYQTGIFGKWHLGDNYPMRPQDQGFAESLVHRSGGIGQTPDRPNGYFDPILRHNGRRVQARGYCTDVFFDAAVRFIEAAADEPFFVYLPTNAPHTPLEISPEYSDPYKAKGLDDVTAKAYGMITNIDENLGRLIEKLATLGLRDKTVVVFLTDNGAQQRRYNAGLRGRKSWTYEGGIRVPCFLQWPGTLAGGRKIGRIAAHVDVLPTLLDFAGVGRPKDLALDGESLVPLLREGSAAGWPDRTLYFQCHRGLDPKRYQNCAAVAQRFKMVGYPGTFSQEDLEPSGEPILELYDVEKDPGETTNLANEQPELLARLRVGYDAWFDDVGAARRFTPGVIHLGSDAENPLLLCRYQDGTYRGGVPHGWSVEIEQAGRYRLTINRGEADGKGRMHVTFNGQSWSRPLGAGENAAVLDLPKGKGVLDAWFVEEGKDRVVVSDNSTIGNVEVRRIE
jgi:arylsulfatase A-like enzyme